MLNKNKFFSILIISLFLISCIIGFYTPKVKSQIVDNLSYYTSLGDGTYNIPYVMSANNGIVFYLTAPIYGNGEYLSGVQFLLKNEGGTATGYLTAFLANDSIATDSHVKNVIQNSSTVFNVVSLPNAYYLVEFIFNKTQQLTNGTTYYLGLTEFGITNMLGQLGTGVIDICGINPSMYNYYPNDVNTLYGSFNNVPEPNLSGFCISYNVYTNREFNYRGTSLVSGLGTNATSNLGSIYPLGITIDGISVFGALDVIFGSLFILGLYFMISSRGH